MTTHILKMPLLLALVATESLLPGSACADPDQVSPCASLLAEQGAEAGASPEAAIEQTWAQLLGLERRLTDAETTWLAAIAKDGSEPFFPPDPLFDSAIREGLAQLTGVAHSLIENGHVDADALRSSIQAHAEALYGRSERTRVVTEDSQNKRRIARPAVTGYQTGDSVESSPVQLADGTVVVGSHDNHVHFIDPDQSDEWGGPSTSGGAP